MLATQLQVAFEDAYSKASASSKPDDWMNAALLAKQFSNAYRDESRHPATYQYLYSSPFGDGDVWRSESGTWNGQQPKAWRALFSVPAPGDAPFDMVLHCPNCGLQHIDAPDEPGTASAGIAFWTNPPHRSHKCHGCGHIWRPADVPTNGVLAVKTKGKNDSPITGPDRVDDQVTRQRPELCDTTSLIARLRIHAMDRANTAFARSSMREAAGVLEDHQEAEPTVEATRENAIHALERLGLTRKEAEARVSPAAQHQPDTGVDERAACEAVWNERWRNTISFDGFGTEYLRGWLDRAGKSRQRPAVAQGAQQVIPLSDFAVELRFRSCREAQAFIREAIAQQGSAQ